jgi:hypothetical protein
MNLVRAVTLATFGYSFLVSAADSNLKVYPIKGLFVSSPTKGGSLIHEGFSHGVDPAGAGAYFETEFKKVFPTAVSVVAEKDKRYTLITSLQIARASSYSVDKVDGTSDIYLPVSGSLYFTNAVSGEVLYTVSATYYHRATVTGSGKMLESGKLQPMFMKAYQGLVGELLGKAKQQFNPQVISATVQQEWNGLYVLDKGQDQGVIKGDSIVDAEGNTLDVVFSGATYSVGALSLGTVVTGKTFSKETNLSLSDIKKPRVMILVDKSPEGFPPEILRQLFSDALGSKAPVSVVHVNELFSQVLSTAFSKTDMSSEDSRKRELPDFFIRLSVPESTDFELPTSLKHKTLRTYSTIATAELVDKSGRVLYAASGADKIVDDVTSGMSFDRSSRREVSIKNALISLANRIGTELKFARLELPINAGGDSVSIKDEFGVLTQGESLVAYRKIGKIEGIAEDVKVPIRGLNVDAVSEGAATATLDLPLTKTPLKVDAGDVIVLEGTSAPRSITRNRFAACGPAEKLGSVTLPAFGDLAINTFERSFNAPFYSSGFLPEVKELLGPGTRFKTDIKLVTTASDYCVEPVYRVDVTEHLCDGESKICIDKANVRITFRIKNGNTVVTKSGLESKMTSSGYMESTSPEAQKNSLAIDLLAESSKLAKDVATKLTSEKFN